MAMIPATLLLAIAQFLITSCGNGTSTKPPEQTDSNFPLTDDPSAQEAQYKWDDENCLANVKPGKRITQFSATSWSQGQKVEIAQSIDSILADGSIDENVIGGDTRAREIYSRSCSRTDSAVGGCLGPEGRELNWTRTSQPGVKPRFCKDSGNYPRDSLERITLEALKHFSDARSFQVKAYLESKDPGPVDLKIIPSFETIRFNSSSSGNKSSIVDQMAYFPANSGLNETAFIAVFPGRKDENQDSPRLWETSFVLAHEYGHHIERKLGFDQYAKTRTVARAAVSEGFADIAGYSTKKGMDLELNNIGCIKDRRISSGIFSDKVEKKIDKALLNALLLREKDSISNLSTIKSDFSLPYLACTSAPSRTLPHGLGAILAHQVFVIASALNDIDPNRSKRDDRLELAKFSRDWLKNVNGSVGAGRTVENDLLLISKAIETAVLNESSRKSIRLTETDFKSLCSKMAKGFSGLNQSSWFSQNSCSN
ncbi:MAG: hypothetical protein NT027_05790 [Proteobacteria bacterium]|nr:hypothetical protein [Pseudomonadota bacterium]